MCVLITQFGRRLYINVCYRPFIVSVFLQELFLPVCLHLLHHGQKNLHVNMAKKPIHGVCVDTVEDYKYLGLNTDNKLDKTQKA